MSFFLLMILWVLAIGTLGFFLFRFVKRAWAEMSPISAVAPAPVQREAETQADQEQGVIRERVAGEDRRWQEIHSAAARVVREQTQDAMRAAREQTQDAMRAAREQTQDTLPGMYTTTTTTTTTTPRRKRLVKKVAKKKKKAAAPPKRSIWDHLLEED